MEHIIQMKNIQKHYGDFHALKDINFEVKKGEIVVVCGPSGSGKSTMIRCINKLEDITSGQIIVENQDINDKAININKLRQKTGMVFQHFNLFPHKTILENITIGPIKVKKIDKETANKQAMKLLEKVKILHQADKYPSELSGGQQQRVAIARALINNPNIIFADEPTGNLDQYSSHVIWRLLEAANRQFNTTIIVVTHNIPPAMNLKYTHYSLQAGKLINETEKYGMRK